MSIKNDIANTINNFKIMINIHRLNRNEKLSLNHSNIGMQNLPKNDFTTEDVPTYIHVNGYVYRLTNKGGRFL